MTRSKKETLRVYGPPERRKWMAEQDCIACGRMATEDQPNANCHIKPNPERHTDYLPSGTARKEDCRFIVPMCYQCHEKHHDSQADFEIEFKLDLDLEAAAVHARWQREEK